MRRVLPKYTKPIYTCELDERVPALVEYPLEEVIEDQRCAYMNNTTATLWLLHSGIESVR